ncbi:MAG: ABC transporter substrate-binding protein [Slackia sp.]|nr:ABC transporter substrate-binding protein [Slackia sp.]
MSIEKPLMRAISACVLALSLAFVATGCASQPQEEAAPEAPAQAASNQVTDAYGRAVELPDSVESVATVGSGARFVVYAGGQDKLIAATDKETEPAPVRPYTMVYAEQFSALPSTSNGNHLMETSVDAEQLLELAPDVIVSSRSAQECDQLQEQTGIPVIGISYQDQLFADDVYASILAVGQALGTEEHARQVVDTMKGWQADLQERTGSIPDSEKPAVYTGAVNFKGAKSFGGTYAQYAPFMAANVKNVADETGQKGSFDVDLEQLAAWNPDIMFLNAGNMDLMKQDYEANAALFDSLSAFQNDKLYTQPAFNFNGTNIEMGICDAYFVGSVVYPEAFADLDMPTMYDEIFSTMLGKDYYEDMKAAGMDFKQISF